MIDFVARCYRPVDREQEFLLPPSMSQWLPDDHLVWFLVAAVDRLDTTRFHERAKLGGVGRRGYDPDMDCIPEDEIWRPEVFEGAQGLFNWGPPPPPSFLAPDHLGALMTGQHSLV